MPDTPVSDTLADLKNSDEQLMHEFEDWFPTLGDKIVVSGRSGMRVDPLGFSDPIRPGERALFGRWDLYADGFKEAADRLVAGIRENDRATTPGAALIYPILFCYRHSLELQLKVLISSIEEWSFALLTKEEKETHKHQKRRNVHGLRALWERLQGLPRFDDSWASEQEREAFLKLLLELDGHDRESQAARYPIDRSDKQTLLNLTHIELNSLKTGMQKISRYLAETQEHFFQTMRAEIGTGAEGEDESTYE
jgi:hypothetical protein